MNVGEKAAEMGASQPAHRRHGKRVSSEVTS
jgi:hypothetical protein